MWRSRRSTFVYIQKGGTDRHEVRTGFVRIGTRTHLSRFLLSISVPLWSWGESLIVADGSLKSNTATNESWMAKVYLRNYSNGQLGLNFCSNFCLEDPPVPLFVIGGSHISSRICIRNDRSEYSIGGLYYPAERTLIECVRRQRTTATRSDIYNTTLFVVISSRQNWTDSIGNYKFQAVSTFDDCYTI